MFMTKHSDLLPKINSFKILFFIKTGLPSCSKNKNGVKQMGIVRSTFLINTDGVLEDVIYGVSADGHAQEMLDKVSQL